MQLLGRIYSECSILGCQRRSSGAVRFDADVTGIRARPTRGHRLPDSCQDHSRRHNVLVAPATGDDRKTAEAAAPPDATGGFRPDHGRRCADAQRHPRGESLTVFRLGCIQDLCAILEPQWLSLEFGREWFKTYQEKVYPPTFRKGDLWA